MESTERVWSSYQKAIFTDVAQGSGHTVVRARAGSGKTSRSSSTFTRLQEPATAASHGSTPTPWKRWRRPETSFFRERTLP